MTKSGFDLDEIERLLAAATPGKWRTCALDQGTQIWCGSNYVGETRDYTGDDADLIFTLHNSAPAMIAELRELRAENARLRGHWSALDKALADNIIETDQPHRVRWEGEWHYGPLADAYFAMTSVVRKLARAAIGEPQ